MFQRYIYIYLFTDLWHVLYSQCKGDEREERAEICKKKEAGGFWCSECEMNAEMTGKEEVSDLGGY